ncbi:T9SS type A sorting domain-containing protein [Ichthyenterobacterium sp. W332]|uniref:T9SS type A sorting domain-containing protein n=1 Tax=Microcosmobacter mediterraneus TaxID=3075607 RepID=A0ABU2YH91_9FLAO|nr:T9SS type A sorting domain-containing protein [Ichthyenterobacterium sp. W332]MDT0557543.1 T9SS type A sorting domain-containing protein [Ichthyenterobacterium sp. W332]
MKKITLFVVLALTGLVLHSQILIEQDFENGNQGWETNLFFTVPIQTCSGTSTRRNLFYSSTIGSLASPNVQGQSNGNDIQVNFDYKIVNWGTATVPTPAGWGNMVMQFSTNGGSTWNDIATIDDSNHVSTNSCVTKSYTISGSTVEIGSDFAFRFYATWASGDYYIYIDDILIQQDSSQSPPMNDAVNDAITLDIGALYDEYSVDASVLGATSDSESASCGLDGPGIWYKFTVPASGTVNIETNTDNATNTLGFDSVIEVFSGPMNNLTSLACNNDSPNADYEYSKVELNGLVPGEELYFRVWENGGDETEPFSVSVYNDALSINEAALLNIKIHPNPVLNKLNIETQTELDQITITNILGQEVLVKKDNLVGNIAFNLNGLNSGAYFVRIVKSKETKVYKVIKQ